MKLRESCNFRLYIPDYWAISYSHPQLGRTSTSLSRQHSSALLPSLPNTPRDTPKDTPKDAHKDTPKDTPMDTPRNNPRDNPRNFPRDNPRNTPRDNPRNTPSPGPKDQMKVVVEVHGSHNKPARKTKPTAKLENFDVSESSDFDSEFTHL